MIKTTKYVDGNNRHIREFHILKCSPFPTDTCQDFIDYGIVLWDKDLNDFQVVRLTSRWYGKNIADIRSYGKIATDLEYNEALGNQYVEIVGDALLGDYDKYYNMCDR